MTSWYINSSLLLPWENIFLFNKSVVILTHMVFCNKTSKEGKLIKDEEETLIVELSKTKEENEVVKSFNAYPRFFSSHEMLQLPDKMRSALIQAGTKIS